MKAEKYLQSIGLENVIDKEFFNDDDKSWYKVQELMESYHKAKLEELLIGEQTIYVTNSSPSDIYAAFDSENRASIEAEESGCYATQITLYKGQRI